MQTSILSSQMNHLRQRASTWNKCRTQPNPQGGICKLTESQGETVEVNNWYYTEAGEDWDEPFKSYIARLSKTICIWIEIWISTLEWQQVSNVRRLKEKCTYSEFQDALTSNRGVERCGINKDKSQWLDLNTYTTLYPRQVRHKDLQMCMETVRLILKALGIKRGHRTTDVEIPATEQSCEKIYEELKKWAGDNFAKELMGTWFTTEDWPQTSQPSIPLPGTDIFEMITERVMGAYGGIKDLVCEYEGGKAKTKKVDPGIVGPQESGAEQVITGKPSEASSSTKVETGEERLTRMIEEISKAAVLAKEGEPLKDISGDASSRGNKVGGVVGGSIVAILLGSVSIYGLKKIFRPSRNRANLQVRPNKSKRGVFYR
ncbi:hypothetical protein C922_05651 [Plasmodium inui San Antonio 1]|uniref:Uncharacterized protein n=1 Tax=Plasmodium inui San Antonio 1 TaxID=1237626 RepID=W6ZXH4_9APIC|nr:hypothetical protein C922_05651 [Plasmodium inui San Antonio 1]EUD63965.1 hypothetical protein C922_05651 [Plasmodium inui San Antonio 1]